MCIRNNDNYVYVIYFIMDGGILGYFWKIFKNICIFLIGIGIYKYLFLILSRKFWQDVMLLVVLVLCLIKKVFKIYMYMKF